MSAPTAGVLDERTAPEQTRVPRTGTLRNRLRALSPDGATLHSLKTIAISSRSRLARRMLAELAYPAAPDQLLEPGDLRVPHRLHCTSAVALATVLGTQPLEPWHRRRALELYDRLLEEGNEIVNAAHQGLHAQLMFHEGQTDRLRETLPRYKNIDRLVRRALEVELLHPGSEPPQHEFLLRFQQFAAWADLDLHLRDADAPLLDRIELTGLAPIHGGQRISVIVTSYRPGPELLTALRSVCAQSWQNWEVLLVDDASGPEFDGILAEAAGLDPRIKLLRRQDNGGTYLARNDALKVASGVFVTGLDSDDWAHPRWLEAQVEPLTRSRSLMMTYAEGIRATPDLHVSLAAGRRITEIRSTSIMYRRVEVLRELGRFDSTRKAADSEFRFRLVSKFGDDTTQLVPGRYTIVRQRMGTLSHGEISEGWLHPARFAYESAFRRWHASFRTGDGDAFLPADGTRRFYAPRHLIDAAPTRAAVDRLLIADWRTWTPQHQALLRSAESALAAGLTVAFAHYPKPWAYAELKSRIAPEALAFAGEHGIEFVDQSDADFGQVVVPDLETADILRFEFPDGTGADPEALDKRVVHVPAAARRRRPLLKEPSARSLLATAAATAVVAVPGALLSGFPDPLGSAILSGGFIFAGGALTLAVLKFGSRILQRY